MDSIKEFVNKHINVYTRSITDYWELNTIKPAADLPQAPYNILLPDYINTITDNGTHDNTLEELIDFQKNKKSHNSITNKKDNITNTVIALTDNKYILDSTVKGGSPEDDHVMIFLL